MTDLDLEIAGVAAFRQAMAAGATSSAELAAGYLARIDDLDQRGPAVHALRCLVPDAAGQAERADAERATAGSASAAAYRCGEGQHRRRRSAHHR